MEQIIIIPITPAEFILGKTVLFALYRLRRYRRHYRHRRAVV
ncbi:MAG TPA: hypothetical protein VNP04_12860 [Alphaproteobacteria bacterium]|nr:hypothetical protein [Alphaproteobacteria bacterium]